MGEFGVDCGFVQARGGQQRELPDFGDLVRGEDRDSVGAGVRYAIAQLALARAVLVDRWIVCDRLDEPGNGGSEPALKFRASSLGLLEQVMKQAGGDDFVWLPIPVQ